MNWWSTNVDEGTELDIALLNDTTSICGDEVILITDNQAMNLKNDASLKYDTLGSSNIQQYALNTKISQASSVKNEMHQIMVPNGKRADITFSDGTRIYINSGSKVIYPDIFEERKREILVEGEVYLDVAKRKVAHLLSKQESLIYACWVLRLMSVPIGRMRLHLLF